MLIAVLLVGLLTGYYFGVKPGAIAAGIAFALLLFGSLVPGAAVSAYALLLLGATGVYFVGTRMAKAKQDRSVTGYGKRLLSRLWRRL
jgi:hypothetical protein